MSRIIHCNNIYHLGDSVFNFILFYNIKNYIEENNIIIHYYAPAQYLNQLKEFICSPNIKLFDLRNKKGLHLWLGNNIDFKEHHGNNLKTPFNEFLTKFLNESLQKLLIPIQLTKFEYHDPELLIRYNELDEKYKNIDILVINSLACSKQYSYNDANWEKYIRELNKLFSIVTTRKIEGIKCTLDDSLTIKNIAALSTQVKVVIAVNTGVLPGLLNSYTLNNVKRFYVFDNIVYPYSYSNFEKKNRIIDISFKELYQYVGSVNFDKKEYTKNKNKEKEQKLFNSDNIDLFQSLDNNINNFKKNHKESDIKRVEKIINYEENTIIENAKKEIEKYKCNEYEVLNKKIKNASCMDYIDSIIREDSLTTTLLLAVKEGKKFKKNNPYYCI